MRLLYTKELETGGFELKEFGEEDTPPYAILSHTWGDEEVTFQDMTLGHFVQKKGYSKIRGCCSLARANGYDYAWVDTCCIDKTSSAELSEAINSMYRWYGEADVCYGYLADVSSTAEFAGSRWFTRGWTLQELIAPETMIFLDEAWNELGTRETLKQEITKRTGIPLSVLSGSDLTGMSIAQKMSWAALRKTSRSEDRAYCLMGIFGINMPLLYGEGDRAFMRLQEEIMKVTDDDSIFAWRLKGQNHGSLLAISPDAFEHSGNIVHVRTAWLPDNKPWTVSNKGIRLQLSCMGVGHQGLGLGILHCAERKMRPNIFIAIYLKDVSLTMEHFARVGCDRFELFNLMHFRTSQRPQRWLNIQQHRPAPIRARHRHQVVGNPPPSRDDPAWGLFDSTIDFTNGSSTTTPENWSKSPPPSLIDMAKEGCTEEAKWLLAKRTTKPDHKDEFGRTALSHAAGNGHAKITWLLLMRRDVKADDKDEGGRTPLHYAAADGHAEVVWLLLTRGDVDIHSKDNEERTPLFLAAAYGRKTVISMLLARGDLSLHIRDYRGRTPLFTASEGGHETAVEMFLDRSDMVADSKDNEGRTPLSLAANRGHLDVARMLIEQGADIDSQDQQGRTPLWWAILDDNARMVQRLLEDGANLEIQEEEFGFTPLLAAAHMGREDIFQLLLDKGANAEATSFSWKKGNRIPLLTPLLIAATDGRKTMVEALLAIGVAVDVKDDRGWTPLARASAGGHIDIMRLLLDHGADVNAEDTYGFTPLRRAILERFNGAAVELLLARGASLRTSKELCLGSDYTNEQLERLEEFLKSSASCGGYDAYLDMP